MSSTVCEKITLRCKAIRGRIKIIRARASPGTRQRAMRRKVSEKIGSNIQMQNAVQSFANNTRDHYQNQEC